jgi:Zn-finger nucleic acid-binding protein
MSSPHQCPRCDLPLSSTPYEGVEAHSCAECYGYWIPTSSLRHILTSQETPYTDDERELAYFPDARFDVETDGAISCLHCSAPLTKRAVLGTILIDICAGHGIWLDTGELKSIQILTMSDEGIRTALLRAAGDD